MLYTTNNDTPGMIGWLGTVCGQHGVNIANFSLGRERMGGDAIALLYLDERIPDAVLDVLRANEAIVQARPLVFDIAAD
jgi:D-3-phosphoglycerate dehydrogenase